MLSISLAALAVRLPEELRNKFVRKPGVNSMCQIPLQPVLEQLAKGVVKIPFGQIRSGSPSEFFSSQTDADTVAVVMPLELLLPVIPKGALARRAGQKKIAIPSDIGAVFGPDAAKAMTLTPAPPSEPAEEPPAPEPELGAPRDESPVDEPPTASAPDFEAVSPEPERMSISEEALPIAEEQASISLSAPSPVEAEPELVPESEPLVIPEAPIRMPSLPPAFRKSAESVSPIRLEPMIQPAPLPKASPPPPLPSATPPRKQEPARTVAPVATIPENGLAVPLSSLTGQWPPALCQALADISAGQFTVILPMAELEEQVSKGRIVFAWAHLSQWMQPPLPRDIASLPLDEPLVLPLHAVVPLFLAKRGKSSQRKQVHVEAGIPNLFVGTIPSLPQPELPAALQPVESQPAAVPAPQPPAAPTTAPKPPPSTSPLPPPSAAPAPPTPPVPMAASPAAPAAGNAILDLSVLFGQPGKKMWTPMEIVQKSAKLPGVSGALVALQDGLLVASELPGTLNGENLAAFLPQMFARMGHYTRELKMSEPSSIMMIVNQVPFQIFKAGNVFFLAYGRSGALLPEIQLQAVAAQLERQSQTN